VPLTSIASAAWAAVERPQASASPAATHNPGFCASVPCFIPFIAARWNGGGGAPKVTPSQATQTEQTLKEHQMNILKNMEAIFLAAAFLTGVTSVANAASVVKHARYDAQVTIEGQQMAVVKVSAKRLSAVEKAAL
jgi:hypothetical protein